jgi:hypothetical protein
MTQGWPVFGNLLSVIKKPGGGDSESSNSERKARVTFLGG